MKLQRYDRGDKEIIPCKDGMLCLSEDVEALEQLNAEMLEVLKKYLNADIIDNRIDTLTASCKSIIEKAEAMK